MKLSVLNEDIKAMVNSLFTDSPILSMALEPKDEDDLEELEDELSDVTDRATYGRSANFTRINTGGEDDVVGASQI